MKYSLIFTAAGIPLAFDSDYDSSNHWRLTKPSRLYKTHVTCYNNFEFASDTYDSISYGRGAFFPLSKEYFKNNDVSEYEYVGFFADDVITDIENVNRALNLASSKNIKAFTISFNPRNPCRAPTGQTLTQNTRLQFAKNSELEILGTFLHRSVLPTYIELLNFYDCVLGWGLDIVLGTILRTQPYVIHVSSVLHNQYGPPHYKYEQACNEFINLMDNVFYDFMHHKYNIVIDRNKPLPWKKYHGSFFNHINSDRQKIDGVQHAVHGKGKIIKDSIMFDSRGMATTCSIEYSNFIDHNVFYSDIEMDALISHNPKYINFAARVKK